MEVIPIPWTSEGAYAPGRKGGRNDPLNGNPPLGKNRNQAWVRGRSLAGDG